MNPVPIRLYRMSSSEANHGQITRRAPLALFALVVLSVLVQGFGPSGPPEELPWLAVAYQSPEMDSDSITVERYKGKLGLPVYSDFFEACYGHLPGTVDSVFIVGHRRFDTRTGVLLYHTQMSSDSPTDFVDYMVIDHGGGTSEAVTVAAHDNLDVHHRIASKYHSRYGMVQVREASSEYALEHPEVADTLYSHITHFRFPTDAPADSTRYYKLWRLR